MLTDVARQGSGAERGGNVDHACSAPATCVALPPATNPPGIACSCPAFWRQTHDWRSFALAPVAQRTDLARRVVTEFEPAAQFVIKGSTFLAVA